MTRARRPNLNVVNALKRRYSRCKGALAAADLFTDKDRIKADMGHLAAVLAMFEPGVDLDAIPPIRPYKPARGRWNRTALAILRKANRPLKAFELARLVMAEQGIEPDRRTMMTIGYSLQAVLARLAAKGLVVAAGKPRRWSIPRSEGTHPLDGPHLEGGALR
jgi:hypothetical protein